MNFWGAAMTTTNNTILITGGSSGIGLALAERFATLGNTVLILGRNEESLAKAAAKHSSLKPIRCDISRKDEREELVLMIEREYPALNVLINNAGVQYNYELADSTNVARIESEITINLTAPIELCSLLLPLLSEQPKAAIVNVSSGLGFVPKRSAPVYCATKAGLHIFTKALRYQLEGSSVRVMELIPPLVDTAMTAGRGASKITPEELVMEFLPAFQSDREEINIGKVSLLRLLLRYMPALVDRILKNE
jgi:short-subunit dehydrogenase involved in D-alanine esterification of teichoic acids